jgi:hypothetical protein
LTEIPKSTVGVKPFGWTYPMAQIFATMANSDSSGECSLYCWGFRSLCFKYHTVEQGVDTGS